MNERIRADEAFAIAVEEAHRAYAQDRAADLPEAVSWGGVAGTRTGVKCLHAHYAFHLSGGEDAIGTWVAEHVEPIHPEQRPGRVAAIDQGTNSIRLLVVEPGDRPEGPPTELARDMVITRLGQGVDRTRRLDPAALGMSFRAIKAEQLAAASGSTDFSMLFVGLSLFLIASAGLLVAMLFRLSVESRGKSGIDRPPLQAHRPRGDRHRNLRRAKVVCGSE
jgi:hypothetical protein